MKLHSAIFYTRDLGRVIDFYEKEIGLPKAQYKEHVYAALEFENSVQLGIKVADKKRELPGAQTATIECNNIEELYKKFRSKNIPVYKELEIASWGTTFSILDPDGNKLEFVEHL